MKIIKKAFAEAKTVHKSVWLAALILPGGFTALGVYFAAKGVYLTIKKKDQND